MARYRHYDSRQTKMIEVSYGRQLLPGAFEHAVSDLIDHEAREKPSAKHAKSSPINAENQRVNDRRATREESREPKMKIRQQGGCIDEQKGVFLQLQHLS